MTLLLSLVITIKYIRLEYEFLSFSLLFLTLRPLLTINESAFTLLLLLFNKEH